MYKKHPNLVKIGKKIQAYRKQKGFSQEAFAEEVQLARTYMGRIERGEQNISIQNLIKIAITLKVEIGDIVPPLSQLREPKAF